MIETITSHQEINTSELGYKNQTYRFEEEFDKERYRGRLLLNNSVVGEVRLRIAKASECPESHYLWHVLEDMFIEPNERRNGLGDLMHQLLLEYAKSNDLAVLYSFKDPIVSAKERLVGFLLKRGFKFHDRVSEVDDDNHTHLNYRFYYTPNERDIGEN